MTPDFDRAIAETTHDPLTRFVAFALARGGSCTLAELRAFQGGRHPEIVEVYVRRLQGVLVPDSMGRLVVLPPDDWPLRRIRSMPGAAQLGLPPDPRTDLVTALAARPPPVAAPPLAGPPTSTFRRSNVSELERSTSKRPGLREEVLAFVGARDFGRYWSHPKYSELFEEPQQNRLLQSALDVSKGKLADGQTITNPGKYLWALFKEFRRQAYVEREL